MSELPEGFTLDPPPSSQGYGAALPSGFTLDSPNKGVAKTGPDVPDLSHIDDEKQLLGELDKIPTDQRQAALDKWASGRVALDRQGFSSFSKRVGDAIGRISQAVPVLGGLTDEGEAALHSMNGGNYDVQLAYSRARNKAQNEAETPKISTPFGDIYESGIEKAAGTIGGAMAAPMMRLIGGTGALPGAVNTTANFVPAAAADAFSRGEGGIDKRAEAASDAVGGPGIVTPYALTDAALLGAGAGRLERSAQNAANARPPAPTSPTRNQIVATADHEGVTVPDFLASDSQAKKNVAGALASQPLTGPIIRNAADDAASQIGDRLRAISDEYSNQGTGHVSGTFDPTAAANSAGGQVRESLQNWMEHESANDLSNIYGNLFSQLSTNRTWQIPHTVNTIRNIVQQEDLASTPIGRQILARLGEAADPQARPNGFDAGSLRRLRTYVGNMIDDSLLPDAGTIKPALKQVYGGLSRDLDSIFRRNNLLPEWQNANAVARQYSEEREALTRVIGLDGSAPAERVVDRLLTMAGTKSGADMQQLMLAKQRASPQVWNELASAAVRRLGQGNASQMGSPGMTAGFSPDKFLTSWNKLSENGKATLFGPGVSTLRNSLDNIATLSDRFRDIRKFQNPSGTAQVTGATTLLAQLAGALAGHPVAAATAVAQVSGAGILSYLLSRPATAQAVSRFGSAYVNHLATNHSQAAMKLAAITLAKHVSDVTGENKKQIEQRLNAMAGAQ